MKRHSIQTIAIATIVFGFIFAQVVRAQQQRGPSTAEERVRAVKVARDLENDPIGGDAEKQRAWAIEWIIEIPDITVSVCFDYFGKLADPPRGHNMEIARQMVISSAAYIIEHPDKAKDEQAIALNGLLGSIKAYQSILKQDSASRWAQMDKLILLRDQGKLDDFVADTRRKCEQENQEPDPDTRRAQASTLKH